MKKPVLVIMAAGMGSRYGGMKQIDPVDEYGHIIVDFSIYDAYLAGFEEVIFVIKKENAEDFHNVIGNRIEKIMKVRYAFQELENLPEGFEVPAGRVKPWGTAHAILSCKDMIDGPFAVINADDYYGREAFKQIYDYLSVHEDNEKYQYAMVGYQLKNTLTENGSVARGVCDIDSNGKLVSVTEHTTIVKRGENAAYTEDDGKSYTDLAGDTIVSMNLWGFSKGFLSEIAYGFRDFLQEGLQHNPLKCEYYLPSVVSRLLDSNKAEVKVLLTTEKWYGVTYKEDKPMVMAAVKKLEENDLLVIEGIHCLNPELTRNLCDENKFKIYISALTQLNIDEHNRIPSTDGRLIRRLVRDARTRGASATRTISMWPSVRRGEEKNIFPYQEEADVMFNSSLSYELAVLKQYVEPLLFAVDKNSKEYLEAKRLLKFFDYFVGIGSECVPTNSLLREFIGGGCFQV